MSVWWMRHPRVALPEPLCYGASEVPIDEAHAQQCAQQLAQQLPAQCQIITSERLRTQTVARRLQTLRPDLPAWQADARLNEMDFGCWEMVPWQQVPRTELDAWNADFSHYVFGGRESVADIVTRAQAAWQAFDLLSQSSGHPVLCITHAGLINAVQCWLQQPAAPMPDSSAQWPTAPVPYGQAREWRCGSWSEPDWMRARASPCNL